MITLPIDSCLASIRDSLRSRNAAVITAAPGAGKSTRVPPALTDLGPVILLQPRRVAARSIAKRIAEERGWTLGREVGWQVRFDSRFRRDTKLLVATEGILTARLQGDPLLSDFNVVILDEFHERSLHSDLALAFARQAMLARDDLKLVVMSATLDVGPVRNFLGDAAHFDVPGSLFPVQIEHWPDKSMSQAARDVVRSSKGHVLCFLPGAKEIDAAASDLSDLSDVDVLKLHGNIDADEQDRAVAPSERRKLILATNIAETSITIDGVTDVVDSGMQKLLRFDAMRSLDELSLERITADSAAQRAGRAGRTAPGRAFRLWDRNLHLEPHREAEIQRVDLSSAVLDVIAWGEDPAEFTWFEPPDTLRLGATIDLLTSLGAIANGKLTDEGRRMHRLPLHPRLARLLLEGRSREAAVVAAMLSEQRRWSTTEASDSDLLRLLDDHRAVAAVRRQADAIETIIGNDVMLERSDETSLRRAIFAAWPDRLARRRERGSDRFVLTSGRGAVLARESSVQHAEYIAAVELTSVMIGGAPQALITLASGVDPEWISPTRTEVSHEIDAEGKVRAFERQFYGSIVLRERQVAVDRNEAARLARRRLAESEPDEALQRLQRRAAVAGVTIDLDALLDVAALEKKPDWNSLLPWETRRTIDHLAPDAIAVPSGRRVRLEYDEHGKVLAAVKLQELFGLQETPLVGATKLPIVFELLAPNGRPVQTTSDLRSFWSSTYAEVRKDLRGRYPKHPWPEDPLTAEPTARTKRR